MDILTCLPVAIVVLVHDTMLCELINDVVLGIYHTLDMLYLMHDLWHRHSVLTPALGIYTGTRYLNGTWHAILDIWFMTPALGIYTGTRYFTPVLAMLHFTWHTATWNQYTWPDIMTPDWIYYTEHRTLCIFMIITFTGAWLLYCYQTFGTPVLLNSCIPEPLKRGDSWYYTPVDPRNRIIMNIGLL